VHYPRLGIIRALTLLSAAVLALVWPASGAELSLSGKVGTAPVLLMLQQEDGGLSGWYLYLRQAKQIRLKGRIDSEGAFQLAEFTGSDNRQTGGFEGTERQDEWRGAWRKAGGGPALSFTLRQNRSSAEVFDGAFRCSARTTDRQFGYAYVRKLNLRLSKGAVTAFSAEQEAVSKAGEQQACSIGLEDLVQKPAETGLLLVSKDDASDAAHRCAIRIVGAGDYLYIQFGVGPDDNDCRGSDATMFRSPRAFWVPTVVNRKTRACRAVE